MLTRGPRHSPRRLLVSELRLPRGIRRHGRVSAARTSARGRGLPAYSVYTDRNDGLAEAAYLLGRLGWQPIALTRVTPLPQQRGLLIIAEPPEHALGENAASALLSWVEQGNTLVLAARYPTGIHAALGVSLDTDEDEDHAGHSATVVRTGGPADDYTDGIERLTVGTRTSLRAPSGADVLWRLGQHQAAGAVLVPRGKGRVFVLGDGAILSGRGLHRDDNLLFLVNVARWHAEDRAVYFDEYRHGFRSAEGFWAYLGHYGQRLALLPPLLVAAAALWRTGMRLGPAVPRPAATQADGVAYASALGRLYQRTGALREPARACCVTSCPRSPGIYACAGTPFPPKSWPRGGNTIPGHRSNGFRACCAASSRCGRGTSPNASFLRWNQAFDQFRVDMLNPGPSSTSHRAREVRHAT